MSTEREAFEAKVAPMMQLDADDLRWSEARNCYDSFETHLLWKGWQSGYAEAVSACCALGWRTPGEDADGPILSAAVQPMFTLGTIPAEESDEEFAAAVAAEGAPQPVAWLTEWGAVSLPDGHASRVTCIEAHKTKEEAFAAAQACEFDCHAFPVYTAAPAALPQEPVAWRVFGGRDGDSPGWTYYSHPVDNGEPLYAAAPAAPALPQEPIRPKLAELCDRLGDWPIAEISGKVKTAAPAREPQLWRHVKTGGVYQLISTAQRESDSAPMVTYQLAEHAEAPVWVRPAAEFYDGRFQRIGAGEGAA